MLYGQVVIVVEWGMGWEWDGNGMGWAWNEKGLGWEWDGNEMRMRWDGSGMGMGWDGLGCNRLRGISVPQYKLCLCPVTAVLCRTQHSPHHICFIPRCMRLPWYRLDHHPTTWILPTIRFPIVKYFRTINTTSHPPLSR